MSLRSSALPKLAQCSSFEGKRGPAGPAALRGRPSITCGASDLGAQGNDPEDFTRGRARGPLRLGPADEASIQWGIEAVQLILGDHFDKLETRASRCKIQSPHMNKPARWTAYATAPRFD